MKAVVIGGGIIGLSCAYYLNKSGWEVTVVDKTDMLDGCSYGNLGMIVPSHFVPLAAPGMVSQGMRWMLNSRSPFYVKPSLSKDLIAWGLKFIRSSTEKHVHDSAAHLLELNLYSKQLYEALAAEPGFDFGLKQKGILMYYRTEKAAIEENHLAATARTMGLDVVTLTTPELMHLEPEAGLEVLGAVHYRCDAHLNPGYLLTQLLGELKQSGVQFKPHSAVQRMTKEGNKIKTVITSGGELEGDIVVIAGGCWLPQLARMAGVSVSLMPGKGYSFTLKQPGKRLNIPAILCEARVAITPMNTGMRYGGTMEIAPVNNKINMNRVKGIVESVGKYFTNMDISVPEEKDVWYGFRPCTPDGLPYIGYANTVDNLLIAGGHAMSGLSLGPATGKIIADLANGRKPEVATQAFSPSRFS